MFPNPINATTTKTKLAAKIPINSLSTRFKRANPIANTHPNHDAPPHQKKNNAIHPHPFPQFTIPFPLTDQSEQIINLGHNPPIKTLSATNYPHVPNTPPRCGRAPHPRRPIPSEKNNAIHPRPFPQFTISFPLTDQSEQIINLGHNPPIKTLSATNFKRANPIANTHPKPDTPSHQKKTTSYTRAHSRNLQYRFN